MSTITQNQLDNMSYTQLEELLWKITQTGKVQDMDWGHELDPHNRQHRDNWRKMMKKEGRYIEEPWTWYQDEDDWEPVKHEVTPPPPDSQIAAAIEEKDEEDDRQLLVHNNYQLCNDMYTIALKDCSKRLQDIFTAPRRDREEPETIYLELEDFDVDDPDWQFMQRGKSPIGAMNIYKKVYVSWG